MSDYEFSDEEREKEIQKNKKTHREENPDLKPLTVYSTL